MKVKIGEDLISPGTYDAELKGIVTIKGTDKNNLFLEFGLINGRVVRGWLASSTGNEFRVEIKNSQRWIAALLGRETRQGEEVDLEKLVGRACRVVVVHERRKGIIYANVKEVLPKT